MAEDNINETVVGPSPHTSSKNRRNSAIIMIETSTAFKSSGGARLKIRIIIKKRGRARVVIRKFNRQGFRLEM